MDKPVKHSTIWCERCNKIIDPNKAVWLELSNTDGKYYPEGKLPEGHVSQGGFSFGRACSETQLKEDGTYNTNVQQ